MVFNLIFYCVTVQPKNLFIVNRDVVTTNGTNGIVIVPKAPGTLNHHSYRHIPILTMMTWF